MGLCDLLCVFRLWFLYTFLSLRLSLAAVVLSMRFCFVYLLPKLKEKKRQQTTEAKWNEIETIVKTDSQTKIANASIDTNIFRFVYLVILLPLSFSCPLLPLPPVSARIVFLSFHFNLFNAHCSLACACLNSFGRLNGNGHWMEWNE